MDVVTGGAGLLGMALGRALVGSGCQVRQFDFREPERLPDGATFLRGDIRDAAVVEHACEGAERVFHLAALMHVGRIEPETVQAVNLGGLENVMAAAEHAGVQRVVFTSSIEIYGVQPETPSREDSPKEPPAGYPAHKWESEQRLAAFSQRTGIETAVTRMPLVLGPGFYHQKIVLLNFELLRLGLPIVVLDNGERRGKAVALSDAVDGLLLAGERPEAAGEAFNICSDEEFTHRGLIEEVIRRTGSRSRVVSVPSGPIRAAFDAAAALGFNPIASEHFHFALHDCVYDIEKAKRMLGYAPKKSCADAMLETYESYIAGGSREMRKAVANALLQ